MSRKAGAIQFNEWWDSGTTSTRMPGIYSYQPDLRDVVVKLSETLFDHNRLKIGEEVRWHPNGEPFLHIIYAFVDGPNLPWWVFVRKRHERYAIFDNKRTTYDDKSGRWGPPFNDAATKSAYGIEADESEQQADKPAAPINTGLGYEVVESRSAYGSDDSSQQLDPNNSQMGESSSNWSGASQTSASVSIYYNGAVIGTFSAYALKSGMYHHLIEKEGVQNERTDTSGVGSYDWIKDIDEESGTRPSAAEPVEIKINIPWKDSRGKTIPLSGEEKELVRLDFDSSTFNGSSHWRRWIIGGKEHYSFQKNESQSWATGSLVIKYDLPSTPDEPIVKTYEAITIRRFVMRNGKVNRLITKLLVEEGNNFGTAIQQTQKLAQETKAALFLTGKMPHYAALFAVTENLNVDSQGRLTLEQQEALRIEIGRALMVGVTVVRNDLLDDQDIPKLVALHWATGQREFLVSDLPSI